MRVKRALSIATLVATATVWLGVTAVTAPAQAVAGTPYADTACWSEPKPNDAPETICGSINLAPANAYRFRSLEEQRTPVGTEVDVNGHPWVMTIDGFEPVSAN